MRVFLWSILTFKITQKHMNKRDKDWIVKFEERMDHI
jgi:hypothetical protein